MAKMNYNRPIFRQMKDNYQEVKNDPSIITFGKYKGKSIKTIPTSYLMWLVEITIDDQHALHYCEEIAKRNKRKLKWQNKQIVG